MADLWTIGNNYTLANLEETVTVRLPLPVLSRATVSKISGNLPPGMRISGLNIIGTPYEVARLTEYKFVLRATLDNAIQDRTFKITVSGADEPVWQTIGGDLPVGNNNTYYILDSSPIDFQLEAIDTDIAAGQTLEYYIADGDGKLPPGTSLTTDGRIVGIVDPLLAIERGQLYAAGTYDTSPYDLTTGGYDFGIRSSNGFDSFFYDTTVWDFSYTERPPNKLNRYYEFTVSVTDGDTVSRRTFKIFVVGDDFFRADNTILPVSNGVFTADNTNLRTPIWVTPGNLGFKRSNNYITIPLDIIDTNTQVGYVNYTLRDTNYGVYRLKTTGEIIYNGQYEISGILPKFIDSGRGPDSFNGAVPNPITPDEWEVIEPETVSQLPSGLSLDTSTGDIAGRSPYQSQVSIVYNFTITATRYTPDQSEDPVSSSKKFTLTIIGEIDSQTTWVTDPNLGTLNSNSISLLRVEATTNVPNSQVLYSLASGDLPPGLQLSYDGEIVGTVNAFGENIYRSKWRGSRSYRAGDIVRYNGGLYQTQSNHTSSSDNNFITDQDLWQEFNYTKSGLTTSDSDTTTLDGNETTIDRLYNFTVNAEDQYKYSIEKREFFIAVRDPEVTKYSNLSLKPFLKESVKEEFRNFIADPEIFIPEHIYRPTDPNFGIQANPKVPVYFGIESKSIDNFVSAISKNHKRKQYIIGDLKTAEARVEGTREVIYEVVYIEVKDPSNPKTGRTRKSFKIRNNDNITADIAQYNPKNMFYDYDEPPAFTINTRRGLITVKLGEDFFIDTRADGTFTLRWTGGLQVDSRTESNLIKILEGLGDTMKILPKYTNVIKADTDAIDVSMNKDDVRYISNLSNMRDNIRTIGTSNRNFVPLWMRSQQQDSVNELGYTPAIVLCYCKPGTSAIIKSAINASGFNFNIFNLDMDRYIIDSTDSSSESKYLVFQNYRFNI